MKKTKKQTLELILRITDDRYGGMDFDTLNEVWKLIKHEHPFNKHPGNGHELIQLPELRQLDLFLSLIRLKRIEAERDDEAQDAYVIKLKIEPEQLEIKTPALIKPLAPSS